MQLDLLDKKILYELGINSRMTYEELSKKINSKKTVVAYRVNQLIKNKVIWKFVPIISFSKLGYTAFKIYLKLHGLTKEKEEQIIHELINDKKLCWVAKTIGNWDLLIGAYTKNMQEVAEIKNHILEKYSKFIQEYNITFLEDGIVFNRDYLLEKPLGYRKEFTFTVSSNLEEIDELQRNILVEIKNDARYKVVDLANKFSVDSRTIISKIKDLENRKIIQGSTIFLNLNKIDLRLFKICIYLYSYSKENFEKISAYIKTIPELIHFIKSIGDWELEVEIEYKDINQAYNFITNLRNKFPDLIKKTELAAFNEEPKFEILPEFTL